MEFVLNQAKYMKELFKKFELENTKINETPMDTTKLKKDENDENIDTKLYRCMI